MEISREGCISPKFVVVKGIAHRDRQTGCPRTEAPRLSLMTPAMAWMPFVCRTSKADGGDRRSVHGRRRVVRRPQIGHPKRTDPRISCQGQARNPWIIRLKKNFAAAERPSGWVLVQPRWAWMPALPFFISLSALSA